MMTISPSKGSSIPPAHSAFRSAGCTGSRRSTTSSSLARWDAPWCVSGKGTACYVHRSADILARVHAQLGIGEDATTPYGLITVQTVACMGHAAWRR